MIARSDAKSERERRQAEALKANLRRRKTQARGQAVADRDDSAQHENPHSHQGDA